MINGTNIEIIPNIINKNNVMVIMTENKFGIFNLSCKKFIKGLAINDNTAAIAKYTSADCILYKNNNSKAIPANIAIDLRIPSDIVLEFIRSTVCLIIKM